MMESGIGITNPLFFIGVIENNTDPHFEGRVKVRAFGIHGDNTEIPATDLPWAMVASGAYDLSQPPPPLNSFVYGMFLDGRAAQHPLVLGLIPTQFAEPIEPSTTGWGVVPDCHGDVLARGSRPEDYGQPQNSRLARGENLEETYVPQQEMNRVEDVYVAGQSDVTDESERVTWSEPSPAYGAKYPFNRVIETAKHSIEIDDTPGAERIMIYHNSGSYVQIDATGATTHKSTNDKYEINDKQQHVYVGGPSVVTINNDAYVYVKGNKTEEIEGDYNMIIHGNAQFGVGQQFFVNAGNQIQMRGADIMLDANVGTMELFAKEDMQMNAGIEMHQYTQKMYQQFTAEWHATSGGFIKYEAADGIWQQSTGAGFNFKAAENIMIQTDATISARAGDAINMDPGSGIIDLASGSSGTASAASPDGAMAASQTEMPEPPTVSTSVNSTPLRSHNGPATLASDDDSDPSHESDGANVFDNMGIAMLSIDDLTVGNTYQIGGRPYTLVESDTGNYFEEQ